MSIRRDNLLNMYRHQRPLFIPQYFDMVTCIPTAFTESAREYGSVKDDWGVTWLMLTTQPGPVRDEKIPNVMDDITEWQTQMKIPDVESFDWEGAAARDTANWDRENKVSKVIIVNGMWERLHSLHGFQDSLMDLLEEPECVFDVFSAIADYRVAQIRKIAKYYKPDIIQIHDDYGTEKNLFFSKATWMELVRPNLKKMVDAIHECGMLYEHHSCGHIAPLLEEFIALGIDAWNPVQSTNHPEELFKKYAGQIVFVGGFQDRLFISSTATDEEKKASIRQTIELGAESGLWFPHVTAVSDDYQDFMNMAVYEHNKPIYEKLGLTGPLFDPPKPGGFEYAYKIKY